MQSPFEARLVRLRAREPSDEPYHNAWFNDPDVLRFLGRRYPVSHAQSLSMLEPDPRYGWSIGFTIETLVEGDPIGQVFLGSGSAEDRSADLGISIGDKSRWGGGYGTDAILAVCRFGFEMMHLHRIELGVYVENERARHVYERIGFRTEACRRQAYFKEGAYHDALIMGLLEGELVDPRAPLEREGGPHAIAV
jgi:RimJ/RimL family protein N-acetyltransferase